MTEDYDSYDNVLEVSCNKIQEQWECRARMLDFAGDFKNKVYSDYFEFYDFYIEEPAVIRKKGDLLEMKFDMDEGRDCILMDSEFICRD